MSNEIDDLLDATLDDLEDLPEFKAYPAGAHRCLCSLELKEINDNQAVELSMKAIETVELGNSSDAPLGEGDVGNVLFMLNNEFGRGSLKKVLASFAENAGSVNNREIIEATKEVECVVICAKPRKGKNDPDKFYTSVKDVAVV